MWSEYHPLPHHHLPNFFIVFLIIFTREFKLQKQKINHIVVAGITNITNGCLLHSIFVCTKMKIVKMKIYICRCNDFILYLVANFQCYSIWCKSCLELLFFMLCLSQLLIYDRKSWKPGEKHTISTFVDQTRIQLSKLVLQYTCPTIIMWFISLKCLDFEMPNRILVSTKGPKNTLNLLSHFIVSFQKKLFDDVYNFQTRRNKNMRLWEQINMAGYQNQKLTEKGSWMKCYPNSKKHELLKMLVNLQWRIHARGGGGGLGGLCMYMGPILL